jgi:hypothetical protein
MDRGDGPMRRVRTAREFLEKWKVEERRVSGL